MATYVVGDVQGCFKTLERLLDKINFDPQKDFLWFIGDLVNVGKNSLKALKWAYKNRDSCNLLIGNHELNLLCIAYGLAEPQPSSWLHIFSTRERSRYGGSLRRGYGAFCSAI